VVHTFTLDEANALIPRIVPILRRLSRMSVALHQVLRPLGVSVAQLAAADGTGRPAPDVEALERARLFAELVRRDVDALSLLGVVVHETHRSVAGFRSVLDGEREVLLCWQLGEREIHYYRDVGAGLEGRQPVEGHRFFRSRQLRAPSE
jgi:hypothetical protein